MDHSPRFLELVNDAKGRVQGLSIAELKTRRAKGETPVLIDVREDSEWAQGHIPGAVHLGRGVLERDVEQRFPDPARELILYCGGGFRSALAADNLQRMGYRNVRSLEGGWREWVGGGGQVEH